MNERQRYALKFCLSDLMKNLDLQAQHYLRAKSILDEPDLDHIAASITQREKRLRLLELLKAKNGGWNSLLDVLKECNQGFLSEKLQTAWKAKENHGNWYEVETPPLGAQTVSKMWEVPHRNPTFIGREPLLQQLNACYSHDKLSATEQGPPFKIQRCSRVVISGCQGMGGVGKTQLAIEYVHSHKNVFSFIFWFPAEEPSKIDIAYQKLAHDLKIDTKQPPDAIVREIKAWFSRNPSCLLVYDNAPDSNSIQMYIPVSDCNVLVTSRNTDPIELGDNSYSIIINVFTIEEAREYIEKKLGIKTDTNIVEKLAERLGYLPLALAQACDYMKQAKLTPTKYLLIVLYGKHKEVLLADQLLPALQHKPVLVTWDITIKKIHEMSPLAVQLLKYCAYLYSDDIPQYLLQETIENKEAKHKDAIFKKALAILSSYLMIKINEEKSTVSIHRILQDVILFKEQKTQITTLDHIRTTILQVIPTRDSIEDIKTKKYFMPHLETLLYHMDNESSGNVYKNNELMLIEILEELQDGYRILGNYNKQRGILKRIRKII